MSVIDRLKRVTGFGDSPIRDGNQGIINQTEIASSSKEESEELQEASNETALEEVVVVRETEGVMEEEREEELEEEQTYVVEDVKELHMAENENYRQPIKSGDFDGDEINLVPLDKNSVVDVTALVNTQPRANFVSTVGQLSDERYLGFSELLPTGWDSQEVILINVPTDKTNETYNVVDSTGRISAIINKFSEISNCAIIPAEVTKIPSFASPKNHRSIMIGKKRFFLSVNDNREVVVNSIDKALEDLKQGLVVTIYLTEELKVGGLNTFTYRFTPEEINVIANRLSMFSPKILSKGQEMVLMAGDYIYE